MCFPNAIPLFTTLINHRKDGSGPEYWNEKGANVSANRQFHKKIGVKFCDEAAGTWVEARGWRLAEVCTCNIRFA